jgi:hypothetical protein
MTRKRRWYFALAGLVIATVATTAAAQIATGTLAGTIRDETASSRRINGRRRGG